MIAKSRFSDRSVKAFKHKKQRDDVIEPGRTGLSIRVAAAPSTLKTWQFLYRVIRDGKSVPRRMPLGKYPATTLKEARKKLADAKRDKEAWQRSGPHCTERQGGRPQGQDGKRDL